MNQIMKAVTDFNAARGWQRYHDPQSLTLAIASEVGELAHTLRWRRGPKRRLSGPLADAVRDEIADILIFVFALCEECDVDPGQAVRSKLKLNGQKYPVKTR